MKKILLVLAIGLLVASPALAYTSPGQPAGFVNDFAGAIDDTIEDSLESDIASFEQKTTHEISVVTIKSLGGDDIESYANTLFREWGIGKKDADNGVLFLVSIDDRKMRIEVGYGLEGALTDVETQHIQDDIVRPAFREGDYGGGISSAVSEIERAIEGEVISETSSSASSGGWLDAIFENLGGVIFFLFILGAFLESMLAPSKSWWLGGIIGMIAGGIIGAIATSWIVIPIFAALGLLFDYFVSRNYRPGRRDGGGDSSFFGGGWSSGSSSSSGGSSFGGFGGGSSGGGGSSSSW